MVDLQVLRSRFDNETMRFGAKDCIYWKDGLDSDGYGRIYVYSDDQMPKKFRVHRLV